MALVVCPAILHGQGPIVFPGGVVSSATYTTGGVTGNGIAPGSLAVLFGIHLATDTLIPDPLLFPTQLGGASVTVGGIAAHLLYVSPSQIDFQMPVSVSGPTTVVVSTAAGTSPPYPINAVDAFGVFTLQGGCGPAAALNTTVDGTLSLNSSWNSISPGDTLAIFGTGLFPIYPPTPDGIPAPSSPLGVYTGAMGGTVFDINGPFSSNAWVGAASGLVGVDQVNVQVPDSAREGCAVPLLISTGASGNSKPVTVSIHRGGGQCSNPPAASYGRIQWVRTIIAGNGPSGEADTVTISLQESPGMQRPPAPSFGSGGSIVSFLQNFGPACPVLGYRTLNAGTVKVQGPGLGPTEAVPAPLGVPEDGQVAGLTEYLAVLPPGTIQPGSFTVTAAGGVDVTAFQASLQIGPGIQITTPLLPGTVLHRRAPVVLNWTGGDSDAWVTLKFVTHYGTYDRYWLTQARASDGGLTVSAENLAAMPAGPVEIDLEVGPENRPALTAPGLSLGGEQSWKYIYRFVGITFD